MFKLELHISNCKLGNIISKDVIDPKGLIIVKKNTIINDFIKKKIADAGIKTIWIYDESRFEYKNLEPIYFHKTDSFYKHNIEHLKEILDNLSEGKVPGYSTLDHIALSIYENIDNIDIIIKYLHHTKEYAEYMILHSINVGFYSMFIGKWLNLPKTKILHLILAGILHDIGKIKIPNHIVNKKGSLTLEEFEVMKLHTILGYELLKDVHKLDENIKKSVLMHHERIDGSGYPAMVSGDLIGEYAKIIAIADVYDAMTSDRVYKKKVSPFDAFYMFLESTNTIFDASIINIFVLNLSSHLTDTKLKLSNGETDKIASFPNIKLQNNYQQQII
jgi:uncharacterized domain HDIG